MDYKAAYEKAKEAGYSDAEIARHLSKDSAKYEKAIQSGYSDADIISHFTGVKPSTPESSSVMDTVKSAAKNVLQAPVEGAKALLTNPTKVAGKTPILPIGGAIVGGPVGGAMGEGLRQMADIASGGQAPSKLGSALQMGLSAIAPSVVKGTNAGVKGTVEVAKKLGASLDDLQTKGAVELLELKDLSKLQKTVKGVDGVMKLENPKDTVSRVINHFKEDKIIADTPAATWDKFIEVKKAVGKRIGAIYNKLGGDKAVAANAEDVIQPLKEEVIKHQGAISASFKKSAQDYEDYYSFFVNRAQENGGKLTLKDARQAVDEVGARLEKVAKGSNEHKELSQLYGKLANVRDTIVEQTASQIKDKGLRNELLKLNEKYSTYTRLSKDITKGTFDSVTKLTHPKEALMKYLGRKYLSRAQELKGLNELKDNAALQSVRDKLKNKSL